MHRVGGTSLGRVGLIRRGLGAIGFIRAARRKIREICQRGDVVVMKTDPPMLGAFLTRTVLQNNGRPVQWLQDVFPEVAEQLGVIKGGSLLARQLKARRNRSAQRSDALVVLDQSMRERVRPFVGMARLKTIHNWSHELQPLAPQESDFRSTLEQPQKLVIGYSGNLGRAHPVEPIVELIESEKARTHCHFVFVGGGIHAEALKKLTAYRAWKHVEFRPYQPRESLSDSMAAMDVHLVTLDAALDGLITPSKFYGVLAAGRPTLFIGKSDGALAQLITSEQVGLCIEGNAKTNWNLVMDRLLDEDLRRAMGNKALQLHQYRFAFRNRVDDWETLIGELTNTSERMPLEKSV